MRLLQKRHRVASKTASDPISDTTVKDLTAAKKKSKKKSSIAETLQEAADSVQTTATVAESHAESQGEKVPADESQTSVCDTEENGDLRDEKTRLRLLICLTYCCAEFYPTTNMTFAQKLVGMKDDEEVETENKAALTRSTQIFSERVKIMCDPAVTFSGKHKEAHDWYINFHVQPKLGSAFDIDPDQPLQDLRRQAI